jgi:hypothetical protein
MHFYRISRDASSTDLRWAATQSDGHVELKNFSGCAEARMELVDVPVDKAGVLALLRRDLAFPDVIKTWALTPRGGLKDIPNGE